MNINLSDMSDVNFNGVELSEVKLNGTSVWTSIPIVIEELDYSLFVLNPAFPQSYGNALCRFIERDEYTLGLYEMPHQRRAENLICVSAVDWSLPVNYARWFYETVKRNYDGGRFGPEYFHYLNAKMMIVTPRESVYLNNPKYQSEVQMFQRLFETEFEMLNDQIGRIMKYECTILTPGDDVDFVSYVRTQYDNMQPISIVVDLSHDMNFASLIEGMVADYDGPIFILPNGQTNLDLYSWGCQVFPEAAYAAAQMMREKLNCNKCAICFDEADGLIEDVRFENLQAFVAGANAVGLEVSNEYDGVQFYSIETMTMFAQNDVWTVVLFTESYEAYQQLLEMSENMGYKPDLIWLNPAAAAIPDNFETEEFLTLREKYDQKYHWNLISDWNEAQGLPDVEFNKIV